MEDLERKVTGEATNGRPSKIADELIEKIDETKKVDAVMIFGSAYRSGGATGSGITTADGFESWVNVPNSYITKIVQPFTDPKCLAILKAFLDFRSKTKEELQKASGISGEELDKLLMMLKELRCIGWETKQSIKHGRVTHQDVFSLNGRTLLLIILNRADELRKYEEKREI